jgi:hypothetical protein
MSCNMFIIWLLAVHLQSHMLVTLLVTTLKCHKKEQKAVTFNTNYLGTNRKLEPKKKKSLAAKSFLQLG